MMKKLPTIVLRHRKENLKKCSLRGLESRKDFIFLTYPTDPLPPMEGYCVLSMDGPPLTKEDANLGLLLIDGTWRYAGVMGKQIPSLPTRSLPKLFRTAYPRYQTECPEPEWGLASIEALYAAYFITSRDTKGLLDNYYWKDEFLKKNQLNGSQ
jgi:pre-rRNA-processing protein TSR3